MATKSTQSTKSVSRKTSKATPAALKKSLQKKSRAGAETTIAVEELAGSIENLMRAVKSGKAVLLTEGGNVVAEVKPFGQTLVDLFKGTPACGMWRDRPEMADPAEYVRQIRKPRA